MAWQDEMIPIVRALINDTETTTTYSDSRLEETIVIAAHLLNVNINFDNNYTITIATTTISPDPTSGTKDIAFINLVCLRAALFIYDAEAKTASRLGIRVSDGPSSVDTSGRLSSSLELSKQMKQNFELAKIEFMAGNSRAGQAVMTPYTNTRVPIQDNLR